jgi:hypothetical protein
MNENFDPQHIGIGIITSYPKWYSGKIRSTKHTDKVRGDLAIETLLEAKKKGYQIALSDGNSAQTFKKKLQNIQGITILYRRTSSSGAAKRTIIKKLTTMDVQAIVIMEPEKVSLIKSIPEITKPLLSNTSDVVVPKRKDALFKQTYPDYMYASETEANKIYNKTLRDKNILTGKDLDFFFGPRAFRNEPNVVKLFLKKYTFTGKTFLSTLTNPEHYSNVLYFPIINALRKKLRVESVEIPFTYPATQKANELRGERQLFEMKRYYQKVTLLVDLMHFLRATK